MTRLTCEGIHVVKVRNHPHKIMLPKSEIVRRGGYKGRIMEMHLHLRDQLPKTIVLIYIYIYTYTYIYTYIYIIISKLQSNCEPKIYNWHTNKQKNQLKYNTKDSHQTTRGENNRRREGNRSNQNKFKTMNKMAIRTYIATITFNVNGLNAPTKKQTGWMDTETRPIYMLPSRDPLHF